MKNMKRKYILLILVVVLLFSNVNIVMASDIHFENFEDELSWTLIGYDLAKEKEIFGNLSKSEIHEVMYSLIHRDELSTAQNLKNNGSIDYSQIIIITSDSSKNLSNNSLSDIVLNDNSSYPLSKTFRYMVEFDLGTGSRPINYYLTTVTRFPIRPPYRFGIESMYTRHDPSWPFNVGFKVKETINGEIGRVTIYWGDINSFNVATVRFEVLRNGDIIMSR